MVTVSDSNSSIKQQIQRYLDATGRPWLLRFPPELESLFDEHVQKVMPDHRSVAVLAGSLIIGLFTFGDHKLQPSSFHHSLLFRVILLWPFTAFILWLVRRPALRPHLDGIYSTFGLVAALCCVLAFPGHDLPSSLVTQVTFALLIPAVTLVVRPKLELGFFCATLMVAGDWLLLHLSPWITPAQRSTSLAQQCSAVVFSLLILYKFNLNRRVAYLLRLQAQLQSSELTQLNQLLVDLSRRDPLTGLANRRYFNERLQSAWEQAMQEASPVSLAIFDVDHFKKLNDTFGHDVGDLVLEHLAKTLDTSSRSGIDLAARLGGEEFAMLYPGFTEDNAIDAAERLRQSISAMRLPVEGIPDSLNFTVSCGVASALPQPGDHTIDLVRCADQALYRAKRGGRNRVCI